MKTISLKDFALTGFIDKITTGSSTDELVKNFGNPEYIFDTDDCGIMYYGDYEFHYWKNTKTIYLIQNVTLSSKMINFINSSFNVDPWFLKTGREFTFKEVKSILEKETVKYTIDHENDFITFKSGVFLDFVSGYKGYGGNNEHIENWKNFDISVNDVEDYILKGIRKE
ncbi:MAG: hypothetical protein V4580_09605 [Bacteroidota bacterium]